MVDGRVRGSWRMQIRKKRMWKKKDRHKTRESMMYIRVGLTESVIGYPSREYKESERPFHFPLTCK